ncbi:hypothetical protein [Oceanobacillus neutriphilus]|uniref:Uncharacterized protein n=1 Tax=Oceanobacillus neutriphilus TaxID=531815 RepID=A0ABQ2NZU9_9BACI|nr:hypothetical protein [Oceanobacillus neutriphilus]GGP14737.1 hypothetical protein GCM10011346_39930 [Oceanobacillus neutriphilus]
MKKYTWRSFSFFTISIIVSLSILFLLYVGVIAKFLIVGILLGTLISIILFFIAMFNKNEKKVLSIIASLLTAINTAIVAFVFLLVLEYPW